MLNVYVPPEETELRPRITVIGCGGGGCNAVNNMLDSLQGVEFLACNSDHQSLQMNRAPRKIQLGLNVTRGLGAGARPDVGRAAADEALDEIMGYLEGSNMVFITAGMGGGTGTGAAPVIARAAKEAGILTVGVVTKPFHFEGAHRMRLAEAGIEELQQHVDTLLIIPNQNLFRVANEKTTFADAFKMADEVLHAGVRGVTDLMVMPGLINLDFADIRAVMSEMGKAMMGTGEATGERRAVEAAEAAINNPLLEDASMIGAKGLLINITGGMDMTLYEVDEACNRIRDEVDPDANIIFGSTFDPALDGKIRVSVVATGIDSGMRNYGKTPGTIGGNAGGMMGGFTASEPAAPLAAQFAAQKPAAMQQMPFGRNVTLRQGPAAAPATQTQSNNAVSSQQNAPMPSRQTGNTTTTASASGYNTNPRAAAMAANPGFFSRASAAAALRIEEEPMTLGSLEADTEEDMYSSYEAGTDEMDIAPVIQSAPTASRASAQQQRGERDGDSFIPPMPMMTEGKPVSAPAQQSYTNAPMTASRSSADLFVEAAPQMQQRAPQQQPQAPVAAPQQQQQTSAQYQETAPAKRPGLFDRLTGNTGRQPQAPAAAPQAPAQPTLTVDNSDRMPAGTTSFDDDLEIPAFLRRQAN